MRKTFTESEVIGLIYLAAFSHEWLAKDGEPATRFIREMIHAGARFGDIFGASESICNCIEAVERRLRRDIKRDQGK